MQTIPSPPSTRREPVDDVVHGVRIVDEYRWLEDADSPETQQWVEEQNSYTRSVLDAVPGHERIHHRLAELLSIGVVGTPRVRGDRAFYVRREGEQNQPVLVVRRDGEERILVDPNTLNDAGLVTLDWWKPSHDGNLLAYGLSENGDEWSTLHVLDVDSGENRTDRIERTRYSTVAWLPDASGFYYTRYPIPGTVPEGEENYHRTLHFHCLGDDPGDDRYVYGEGLDRETMVGCDITDDGRYLLIRVDHGWNRTDLYLLDREDPDGDVRPFVVGHDALFSVSFAGDSFYIHTNLDAPRFRLLRATPDQSDLEEWEEIIPESPDAVLNSIALAGGRIVAEYGRNATSEVTIFDADGRQLRDVPLPMLGTITALSGTWAQPDAYIGFESFVVAPTIYRLPDVTGEPEVWARVDAPVDPEAYEVRQDWYASKDGTRVSMFIVHRRDVTLPAPAVLTGYGGFNIGRTPAFGRSVLFWLERGGVFALPNLRGGSEYGEDWHRAGMLERKQNVFDDFIGAAEALIDGGVTDREHLCIMGGSNGGLLVGAAVTQRPDLFRAVVCRVPLLDMIRYHLFLIARLWIPEYGSSEDPEQFRYLHAYSPYHHVEPGTEYPAIMFMTAESDGRVDPMHARKMAALMQANTGSSHPILLRVESRAGHGAGKPLSKLVDDESDYWTFVCSQLGVGV